MKTWMERLILTLMISASTLGFIIAASLLLRGFFDAPPINIRNLNTPLTATVCPGEEVPINNHVKVTRPTILFGYVTVMDEHTDFNLTQAFQYLKPRLHPHPSEFNQRIPWEVPDLPPGRYVRVMGIRGHDSEQDPLFVQLPFEIGRECNNGTSD